MGIAVLSEKLSIESYWEELVYTEARLAGDAQAQPYAPAFKDLLVRLGTVRDGQLAAWQEEVSAQAAVAATDDRLDDWVRALAKALLRAVRDDLKSPRYLRYFASSPSSIIRLGLETEIARVRGWTESLAGEPEKELQDLAAELRGIVTQADQVIERRRQAAASRSDHRVRVITSLIDDINSARLSLYGSLTKQAADQGLPRDWPDRFFRHGTRAAKDEPASAPASPTALVTGPR